MWLRNIIHCDIIQSRDIKDGRTAMMFMNALSFGSHSYYETSDFKRVLWHQFKEFTITTYMWHSETGLYHQEFTNA
jgi:hypothetical protein